MKTTTLGIIVVVVVAVVGIGAFLAMQPSATPTSTTTTTTQTTTQTTTTTTASWQDMLSELKLGVIYTSPLDEPWGKSLHLAIEEFQDQYGALAAYDYTESVAIGDEERVLRGYADSGHQLIIAHSYYPAVATLTSEYPEIPWVGSGGGMEPIWMYPEGIADPNYIHIQPLAQHVTYLQGEVAGRLTQTNKVGIVGRFPVWNSMNSMFGFLVGVKNANPEAELSTVWISSWWDPVAAKTATESLIASGVDVVYSDATGVEAAAEEQGVYHFAWEVEYPTGVSDATVGYGSWNLRPFVYDYINHWAVGDIMDWIAQNDHLVYYEKFVAATPYWQWSGISQEIQDMIAAKTDDISSGEITIQTLGNVEETSEAFDELWAALTPELVADIISGNATWP